MPNIYEMYETEKDAEFEIDFGDFQIWIKQADGELNKKFGRVLRAKTKPVKRAWDAGTLPDDKVKEIMREVYAEAVVTRWNNVTDRKSKVTEFSPEACVNIFKDLPVIYGVIIEEAQKVENFRKAALEIEAKN